MKIAIYARYSTDLQDRTSITGQISNCEVLAEREELDVVAHFQDEGISGNDDSRPGYGSLLASLKDGEVQGVLCDETSRLTRNPAELHRIVAELRFQDQFLLTCDGVDTRQESAEILLSVKAAMDQMEGRKIGHRTYRSLRERHKAGHSAGGRIYGYTSEQQGDYVGRIVAPDQASVVIEIFERYAKGESSKVIARGLNARSIPSPGSFWNLKKRRAVGWSHTTLLGSKSKASGILRNPIYTGRVVWNKRRGKKVPGTGRRVQKLRPEAEWIESRDEALRIVPDELFQRVQKRLKIAASRSHPNNKGGRPARYLLSGLMTCASCGGHYVVANTRAYTCSSQTNGRDPLCAQKRRLPRQQVESRLLEGVKEKLLAPSVVKDALRQAQKRLREVKRQKRADPNVLQDQLATIDRQISDVVDTLVTVGQSGALTAKLAALETQRNELVRHLNASEADSLEIPDIIPGFAARWREVVSDLERLHRRAKIDPDQLEKARNALQDLLGKIVINETPEGVFAEVGLKPIAVDNPGAQERT